MLAPSRFKIANIPHFEFVLSSGATSWHTKMRRNIQREIMDYEANKMCIHGEINSTSDEFALNYIFIMTPCPRLLLCEYTAQEVMKEGENHILQTFYHFKLKATKTPLSMSTSRCQIQDPEL